MDITQRIKNLLSTPDETLIDGDVIHFGNSDTEMELEEPTEEAMIASVIEVILACNIPIHDKTFEENEKLNFMCDIFEKSEEIHETDNYSNKVSILEDILNKLDLDDNTLSKCSQLINDYTDYPYYGEESSEKYTFEHMGLKCRVRRQDEWWTGRVYITGSIDMEGTDYIYNPLFDVHAGIDCVGTNHLGFSCNSNDDISSITQIVESLFTLPGGVSLDNVEYRDYHYVCEQTRKLAEKIREHVEP